ncbi:hypothetical protein [Enteractinococcus coprophilus]|uniref:Uncharacterized protein n=1 Tax=Enteractinococcus coprophilus TaxID=1027633 RepID=A0A543AIZ2_9MICC|nr:hypothetical protein [Enteractinococcus coprophilus]TQL72531.1 hypothetical protein FB556_1189 [Enteractinococcus coprophilus]
MSESYPSRRELRLQREREARAKLRDEEAQRWASEIAQRGAGASPDEPSQPDEDQPTDVEETGRLGRRASASPIDTPAEGQEDATAAPQGARRRRRADSEVTSTGMIPIISKPRDDQEADRPLSRRQKRELEARRAAERRAEAARLHREQEQAAQARPARRVTAPQTTPIAVPLITEAPVSAEPAPAETESAPADDVDVTLGESFTESAAEITDMSGLDTIEIRRAELRAETERLTQEILEMGQANPNVIDPVMLRRQKELAEKSQELQNLETAAIAIVEETEEAATKADGAALQDSASDAAEQTELVITDIGARQDNVPEDDTQPVESDSSSPTADADTVETDEATAEETPAEPPAAANEPAQPIVDAQKPSRRRTRRAQSPPMISGPFDVDHNAADKPAPVPSPALLEELQRPAKPSSGEPVDATYAHGLDSVDAKDFEAPERRMFLSSVIVFAIGIIALITAIILLIR